MLVHENRKINEEKEGGKMKKKVENPNRILLTDFLSSVNHW